jgi:hypothetical protein
MADLKPRSLNRLWGFFNGRTFVAERLAEIFAEAIGQPFVCPHLRDQPSDMHLPRLP